MQGEKSYLPPAFDFKTIDAALGKIYTEDKRTIIYKILAGILFMGNIEFEKIDDDSCNITSKSEQALLKASSLVQINPDELKNILTEQRMMIRESEIRCDCRPLISP